MSISEDEIDIVDRIARDLPAEVRAAYYRELNYCRSLPESDELLRILRAMQFLTFLMREVPARVVSEREKLERLLSEATDQLKVCADRASEYRSVIEGRLAALPVAVAEGLRPELIAREINESLRQQFVRSTIPQTAEAMRVVAAQLQGAVAEFGKTAAMLNHAHRGTAEDARRAVEKLDRTVSDASARARQAAEELSSVFRRELRWSIYTLVSLTLALAFGAGMFYQQWIDSPTAEAPARTGAVVEKAPARVKQKPAH